MDSSRSGGDILLELLTKVPDASTLELLLEPQHLVRLLRAHGWTDEDIRRDLTAGGRAPGELLLDVLARQPDSAVLMDLLGHPAPLPARVSGAAGRPNGPASPVLGPARAVAALLFGVLLAGSSGWYLFVRLDVLRAPGLIVHFPGAYTLLFSALVLGLLAFWKGVRSLYRLPRRG
jgi:hypothetical protein